LFVGRRHRDGADPRRAGSVRRVRRAAREVSRPPAQGAPRPAMTEPRTLLFLLRIADKADTTYELFKTRDEAEASAIAYVNKWLRDDGDPFDDFDAADEYATDAQARIDIEEVYAPD